MPSDDALDALSPQWEGTEDVDWLPHEILPNLFMGGTGDLDVVTVPKDNPDLIPMHGFDAVVTLYARAQPVGWGVVEHRFGCTPVREARQVRDVCGTVQPALKSRRAGAALEQWGEGAPAGDGAVRHGPTLALPGFGRDGRTRRGGASLAP